MGRGGGWFRNHRSHRFSKLVPGLLSLLDRIWVDVGESASRGVSDLVHLELTLRRWTRCRFRLFVHPADSSLVECR